MTNTTFVTITAATVVVPAEKVGIHAGDTHLIGLAMLIAERDAESRWRFALRARVVAAGTSESAVLEWAADRMPIGATVIGWQLGERLIPTLIDAASHAEPATAHYFTARLARLVRGLVVDLALDHGGMRAEPFADIATKIGIEAPAMDVDQIFTAWAFGSVDGVCDDIVAEAIALWRCWLRTAGDAGVEAGLATDAWLARRSYRLDEPADGAA